MNPNKTRIRTKYAGLVLFISRYLSVVTGFLFSLIIIRNMPTEELGVWNNMGDLVTYFTFLSDVIPFWAARYVARGREDAAKTALILNFSFSIIALFTYLISILTLVKSTTLLRKYIIFYGIMSFYIFELYILSLFRSLSNVMMPEAVGYAVIIFEISKVIIGFSLVYLLHFNLFGAILTILMAHALELFPLLKGCVNVFSGKFNKKYVANWFYYGMISIYNKIGIEIYTLIYILLFIYGGGVARAYIGICETITSVISYSASIATPIYAKILRDESESEITETFDLVLMFAIPLFIGSIFLSKSLLTVMKVQYTKLFPILIILSISSLFKTFSLVFTNVISGLERVDFHEKITLRELVKSKIFALYSRPYVSAALLIPLSYYILTNFDGDPFSKALLFAFLIAVGRFINMVFTFFVGRSSFRSRIFTKHVYKYLIAVTCMLAFLAVVPPPKRLSWLGVTVISGAAVYFVVLALIDRKTRMYIRSLMALLGVRFE